MLLFMGQAPEVFELGAIVKEAAKCIVEARNVVAGSVGEVEAANADSRRKRAGQRAGRKSVENGEVGVVLTQPWYRREGWAASTLA